MIHNPWPVILATLALLLASGHDLLAWLMQPRVQGYVPHPFMRDFWRHVDVAPVATAS